MAWIRLLDAGSPARALLDAVTGRWSNHPLYSGGGVVWIMGLEHAALVFLAVTAAIRGLPCDLVEAARAAGARGSRILPGILLPLLRPAFVAGAALAFVSAIGNFGVPALLGIPGRYSVLTTLIYQRLSGFGPSVLGEVAALALVLAVLAALGLGLQRWAAARAPVLVRTGPTGPVLPLGRARPWVEAALWLIVGVLSVAPLLALLASALVPALGVDLTFATASLDQFGYILFQHDATRRAFLNSALLAAAAALATAAVGLVLAYYAEARRWRAMRWLDTLADLPYALPGVLTAIAAILLLLRPLPLLGVSLYGTLWIILAAYLGRFLALALRPVAAAIAQADPAPEEAGPPGRRPRAAAPARHPAARRGARGRDRRHPGVPDRLQRADGLGPAVVARQRDGRGDGVLAAGGRRRHRRLGRRRADRAGHARPCRHRHPVRPPPAQGIAAMAAVDIERVVRRFGQRVAVDGVGLQVAQGEFLALLGPSGCGKTTLLRLLAGFDAPDAGTIRIGGRVVAGGGAMVPAEERGIGMVFQSYALWPHMTVRENVDYALRIRRLPAAERTRQVRPGAGGGRPDRPRRGPARTRCPAASASASLWPAAWRWRRRWC